MSHSQKTIFNTASSAILNLYNFDFFVTYSSLEWKFASAYQICLKLDNVRLRYGEKSYFQNGGRQPSWICENFRFGQVTYICMWFFISDLNFALIGQYVAEIQPENDFQYVVRPLSWFCKIPIFCQMPIFGMEIRICISYLIEIG